MSLAATNRLKKNSSSYFLFARDVREQQKKKASTSKVNLKDLNESIADLWKNASQETKDKYILMAAKDKARYDKQVEEKKLAGTWIEKTDDATKTVLPAARIKRIVKLDDEVKHINKEALFLITRATELFVKKLAQATGNAIGEKRYTMRVQHLCYMIHNDPLLDFLRHDFTPCDTSVLPKKKSTNNSQSRLTKNGTAGTQSISNFYAPK